MHFFFLKIESEPTLNSRVLSNEEYSGPVYLRTTSDPVRTPSQTTRLVNSKSLKTETEKAKPVRNIKMFLKKIF